MQPPRIDKTLRSELPTPLAILYSRFWKNQDRPTVRVRDALALIETLIQIGVGVIWSQYAREVAEGAEEDERVEKQRQRGLPYNAQAWFEFFGILAGHFHGRGPFRKLKAQLDKELSKELLGAYETLIEELESKGGGNLDSLRNPPRVRELFVVINEYRNQLESHAPSDAAARERITPHLGVILNTILDQRALSILGDRGSLLAFVEQQVQTGLEKRAKVFHLQGLDCSEESWPDTDASAGQVHLATPAGDGFLTTSVHPFLLCRRSKDMRDIEVFILQGFKENQPKYRLATDSTRLQAHEPLLEEAKEALRKMLGKEIDLGASQARVKTSSHQTWSRRNFVFGVAAVILLAVVVAVSNFADPASGPGSHERTSKSENGDKDTDSNSVEDSTERRTSQAPSADVPADVMRIRTRVLAGASNFEELGWIGKTRGLRASCGNLLQFKAYLTDPALAYVFKLEPGKRPEFVAELSEPHDMLAYPRREDSGVTLEDPGTMVIVVVASSRPLGDEKAWLTALGDDPWKGTQLNGALEAEPPTGAIYPAGASRGDPVGLAIPEELRNLHRRLRDVTRQELSPASQRAAPVLCDHFRLIAVGFQ